MNRLAQAIKCVEKLRKPRVARSRGIRVELGIVLCAALTLSFGVISFSSQASAATPVSPASVTPRPIVNGDAPKILGTPKVGQTLTAQLTNWTLGATFVYTWASGACSATNGQVVGPYFTVATGSQYSSYTLVDADRGKCIILRVDASKSGYDPNWKVSSSATTMVMQDFTTVPIPTISGTPQVGQTLTADPKVWVPAATPTYQWYAGSTLIPNQTTNQLVLLPEHINKSISVVVTGTGRGLISRSSSSMATSLVTAGPIPLAGTPTIEGTVASGYTLTAKPGTWTRGTYFTYQWFKQPTLFGIPSGFPVQITGTNVMYDKLLVGPELIGYVISVKVTGKNSAGYLDVDKWSTQTVQVIRGDFTVSGNPTFSGKPIPGQTLTVDPKTWGPVTATLSYVWKIGGRSISTTVPTFTLQAGDAGQTLTVEVTGRSYYLNDKTTTASIAILGAFQNASSPSIVGTPAVGETLTGLLGSWSPTPTSFSYRWLANGEPIANATSSQLVVSADVAYKNLTFEVTPVLAGYFSEAKVSQAVWATERMQFIDSGSTYACGIVTGGVVKCWGDNFNGTIGDGTTSSRLVPTAVVGVPTGATQVASGRQHTCALATGAVYCWGNNSGGQLGDGTLANRLSAVAVVGLGAPATSVAVGFESTCALLNTGAVKCWGRNSYGQLGNGTTTSSATPVQVSGLSSGVKAIAMGSVFACAIESTNAASCWGSNSSGELGSTVNMTATNQRSTVPVVVTGLSNDAQKISAGASTACVITTSGAAKCWGSNYYGQVGNGTTTNRTTATQVSGLTASVASISVGEGHVCAVLQNGNAKCWGDNAASQLGNNSTTSSSSPVSFFSAAYQQVSAGDYFTCALESDVKRLCVGSNYYGQLGNGTRPPPSTPPPPHRK